MRITFTGDILVYESQDRGCLDSDGRRDYRPIFEQVKPLFEASDYVVGSLETTFSGELADYTHAAKSFNTPDELASALKWTGFNLLTTANNHCLDRGEAGLMRTLEVIKQSGLEYTGTRLSPQEPKFLLKDIDDTRIAFVAYTYGTNSRSNGILLSEDKTWMVNLTRPQDNAKQISWQMMVSKALSKVLKPEKNGSKEDCVQALEIRNGRNSIYEKKLTETIIEAKACSDIVIVCLHSGGQFNSKVGAYTKHLFDIIADAGANAIVCNHAHTTLPLYYQGNCLIASALGNFSFAPNEGYWVDGVKAEYSALLTINIVGKKIVDNEVKICKCVRNDEGLAITIPVMDKEEIKLIEKRLYKQSV